MFVATAMPFAPAGVSRWRAARRRAPQSLPRLCAPVWGALLGPPPRCLPAHASKLLCDQGHRDALPIEEKRDLDMASRCSWSRCSWSTEPGPWLSHLVSSTHLTPGGGRQTAIRCHHLVMTGRLCRARRSALIWPRFTPSTGSVRARCAGSIWSGAGTLPHGQAASRHTRPTDLHT